MTKSVPLYCTLKKAGGVDSFLENIIRKQAENIYFYQCQKIPKNTENILFTKGVQYVNVQCKGFLKWKSAAKVRQMVWTNKGKSV